MEIDKNDVFEIIEYFEVIKTTMAKIGRQYAGDEEAFARAICYFIIDYDVFKKINIANKILVNVIETHDELDDVLDDFYEKLSYWSIPDFVTKQILKDKIKEKTQTD